MIEFCPSIKILSRYKDLLPSTEDGPQIPEKGQISYNLSNFVPNLINCLLANINLSTMLHRLFNVETVLIMVRGFHKQAIQIQSKLSTKMSRHLVLMINKKLLI